MMRQLAVREVTMKTCMHCKKTKPLESFRKAPRMRDGRENGCKDCHNERRRAAYHANPQPVLERNGRWAKANKKATNEYRKSWSRKGYVHYRSAKRRQEIANLSDSYVRQILVGDSTLTHADIPQPMVDVHREVLRLKRAIRDEKC